MEMHISSPRIIHFEWGRLELDNGEVFKDAKVFPGGARAWDWSETGTEHMPGIQPTDVEELLDHGATVVILSRGFNERLQVCPETIKKLEDRCIDYHVLQTEEAIKLYNELRKKERIGGLFHSTC